MAMDFLALFRIFLVAVVRVFGQAILEQVLTALDSATDWVRRLLFLKISGPRTWQRNLRTKRGQCLACGYSLAGNRSGICPECGTASEGQCEVLK
jgi:rubrerythrin